MAATGARRQRWPRQQRWGAQQFTRFPKTRYEPRRRKLRPQLPSPGESPSSSPDSRRPGTSRGAESYDRNFHPLGNRPAVHLSAWTLSCRWIPKVRVSTPADSEAGRGPPVGLDSFLSVDSQGQSIHTSRFRGWARAACRLGRRCRSARHFPPAPPTPPCRHSRRRCPPLPPLPISTAFPTGPADTTVPPLSPPLPAVAAVADQTRRATDAAMVGRRDPGRTANINDRFLARQGERPMRRWWAAATLAEPLTSTTGSWPDKASDRGPGQRWAALRLRRLRRGGGFGFADGGKRPGATLGCSSAPAAPARRRIRLRRRRQAARGNAPPIPPAAPGCRRQLPARPASARPAPPLPAHTAGCARLPPAAPCPTRISPPGSAAARPYRRTSGKAKIERYGYVPVTRKCIVPLRALITSGKAKIERYGYVPVTRKCIVPLRALITSGKAKQRRGRWWMQDPAGRHSAAALPADLQILQRRGRWWMQDPAGRHSAAALPADLQILQRRGRWAATAGEAPDEHAGHGRSRSRWLTADQHAATAGEAPDEHAGHGRSRSRWLTADQHAATAGEPRGRRGSRHGHPRRSRGVEIRRPDSRAARPPRQPSWASTAIKGRGDPATGFQSRAAAAAAASADRRQRRAGAERRCRGCARTPAVPASADRRQRRAGAERRCRGCARTPAVPASADRRPHPHRA